MIKNSIRQIVILSLMTGILLISKGVLSFLPNIELVTLLLMVYTLVFGVKVFYIIYAFVLVEGIIYGFGLWWVSYLYIWTILALVTLLFRNNKSVFLWAFVAGIHGLLFGAFCGIPYIILGGISFFISYWINGIPFDIIHCISNFICVLTLFIPIKKTILILNKRAE